MDILLTQKEKTLIAIMTVFFVLTVLAPGAGLQYLTSYSAEQSRLKNQLEKEIVEFKNKLSGIEGERETVRANREDYLNWVEKGVVGEQDPVVWVKEMKNVQVERNLFPLSYNFASEALQSPDVSPFTLGSTAQIRLWDMTMQMGMLHDMDTLMFLNELDKRVDSFFFPVECNFNLLQETFSLVSRQNMDSSCKLTWISVEDPERKTEQN
ncbi:MAG: hypothetical protein K0U19_06930 [Proteobacteria bacterium]|nr:hypothetical protein [Pseudomonadota bacterium]